MKQSFYLILMVVAFHLHGYGQLSKGNWLMGGNGVFSDNSYTQSTTGDKYHNSAISFSPGAGYFILPKFPVGIRMQLGSTRKITTTNLTGTTATEKAFLYDIGPFVRYYILKETSRYINLFVEANYGFGNQTYTYLFKQQFASHHWGMLAGPVIFFNNSLALELSLGYYDSFSNQYNEHTTGIQGGIGFQVHLGREK